MFTANESIPVSNKPKSVSDKSISNKFISGKSKGNPTQTQNTLIKAQ